MLSYVRVLFNDTCYLGIFRTYAFCPLSTFSSSEPDDKTDDEDDDNNDIEEEEVTG